MGNFRFKRVKNKFRWESNFMVLEFSNPSIQGYDDFIMLEDENQIMYYYYEVKIYKKINDWDKNDNDIIRWELVSKRCTHDFPNIICLKDILICQLEDDTKVDGQKHTYRDGSVRYSKTLSTDGFACDDFYEITKYVDEEEEQESEEYELYREEDKRERERYIVYCGNTYDFQGDLNSSGIRTPYVYKEDIVALKECVEEFIKYSIEIHNKSIELYKESLGIKNNKLYEYKRNGKDIDKNIIEAMYTVGDNVSIVKVTDNIETDIEDVVISNISEDTVTVGDNMKINVSDIVYININPTKEMYEYKEEDIAKDFLNILSEDEIEEFYKNSIYSLLKKYKSAIIDRTSMCREEHNFDIDYNSGSVKEKLTPILLDIIFLIKQMISPSN